MNLQFSAWLYPYLLLGWVALLSFFFAKVEIHIEGDAGWATSLPTWRIEEHWLLDIFWGGHALTGYHFWIFMFMILMFHLPVVFFGYWTLKLEARIVSCLIAFWTLEDFLWFALNPAFGLAKFRPAYIPWHKRWWCFVPTDYIVFTLIGAALFWYSF